MGNDLPIVIRSARADDLPAIQRIYNREILDGVATWDEWPWSPERRRAWFAEHRDEVVLVAVGERSVVGFAYLSPYRGKSGYRFTRECTFYVDPAYQRRGVGRRLLAALLEEARRRRRHSLLAWIEAGNQPSLALARSFGFEQVGRERESGYKHGRWLDVISLQLLLQPADELERLVEPGFHIATVTTAEQMAEALTVRRAVFVEEQGIAEDEEIDGYDADPSAAWTAGRSPPRGCCSTWRTSTRRGIRILAGSPCCRSCAAATTASRSWRRCTRRRGGAASAASRSPPRSTRCRSTSGSATSRAARSSSTRASSTAGWTFSGGSRVRR